MQVPIHPFYLHIENNLRALWDHQQQLEQQINDRFQELENEHTVLKERINQMKSITIENINYKIQELTVQQLSGTLNIGMSALTDAEELQKWLKDDVTASEAIARNDSSEDENG